MGRGMGCSILVYNLAKNGLGSKDENANLVSLHIIFLFERLPHGRITGHILMKNKNGSVKKSSELGTSRLYIF